MQALASVGTITVRVHEVRSVIENVPPQTQQTQKKEQNPATTNQAEKSLPKTIHEKALKGQAKSFGTS